MYFSYVVTNIDKKTSPRKNSLPYIQDSRRLPLSLTAEALLADSHGILYERIRLFVHHGEVHDQVEQVTGFLAECIQRPDGVLGPQEIVVEVMQLDLDGCLVAGEGNLPDIVLVAVLLPVTAAMTSSSTPIDRKSSRVISVSSTISWSRPAFFCKSFSPATQTASRWRIAGFPTRSFWPACVSNAMRSVSSMVTMMQVLV